MSYSQHGCSGPVPNVQTEADAEYARNATLPPLQSVMELTSAWRAPERNADPDAIPAASPGASNCLDIPFLKGRPPAAQHHRGAQSFLAPAEAICYCNHGTMVMRCRRLLPDCMRG